MSIAKNMKAENGVADVSVGDIWKGDIPQSGYLRTKLALTAIAYPLADNAKIEEEDGRLVVSFPISIKLPKGLTREEVESGIEALCAY